MASHHPACPEARADLYTEKCSRHTKVMVSDVKRKLRMDNARGLGPHQPFFVFGIFFYTVICIIYFTYSFDQLGLLRSNESVND